LSSQEDGPTNNVKEVSTNLNVDIKPNVDKPKIEIPEDAFLMVTQMNWEDDVIWNGEDIKHKVRFVVHKKFEPS
jgi:transcription initiation factor TFIID subunit 1